MTRLCAGKNGLYGADGKPFCYLADTAWTLLHRLTKDDMAFYLDTRAAQGYNAVQVAALTEDDGLRVPNAYGQRPLLSRDGCFDPAAPDEAGGYWNLLDEFLDMANRRGILVALLPTWGDKFNRQDGLGPEIFTPENAYRYGLWLGRRCRNRDNLLWVLGGDRPLQTPRHTAVMDEMARGLREGDGGAHLITFHPPGAASSVDFLAGRDYLDFHAVQSSHALDSYDSWRLLRRTREREDKPCLDMECRYEDFPACFEPAYGYRWTAADLRQNLYSSLMEGACGFVYGHASVWCFREREEDGVPPWREALLRPGARQTPYAARLRLSRPYAAFRPAPELIDGDAETLTLAGRGERYAFVYAPAGQPLRVRAGKLGGKALKESWFNPCTGKETAAGCVPPRDWLFTPPSGGRGRDWVLILDVL